MKKGILLIVLSIFILISCEDSGDIYTPSVSVQDVSNLVATPGNGMVLLTWTNPYSMDNVSSLSCYYNNGSSSEYISAGDQSAEIYNLTNGMYYDFNVSVNDYNGNRSYGTTVYCTPSSSISTNPSTDPSTDPSTGTYSEGYNAYTNDFSQAKSSLATEMVNDPLTGNGSKNWTVYGTSGGSASLNYSYSMNMTPFVTSVSYSYTFNSFRGSNGSTINGSYGYSFSNTSEGSLTGNLSFVYGSESGSTIYNNCTVSTSGETSGSYTVTYMGTSNTYNF